MEVELAITIQARVSSLRFPRKVLSPLGGVPMLMWTISYCSRVNIPLYVLTSTDKSDNDLVDLLENYGINFYRGNLDNVVSRYLNFMTEHKIKKVVRINGDSPLINPEVILKVIESDKQSIDCDLTTNVFPRSFPKGQSVEIIPFKLFKFLSSCDLQPENFEHVTSYFYENSSHFKINNVKNDRDLSSFNLSVDTKKDFENINKFIELLSLKHSSPSLDWMDFSNAIVGSRMFQ